MFLVVLCLTLGPGLFALDDYTNGPDSFKQAGVPEGVVSEHEWSNSRIYPGIYRKFWIYTPANYDGKSPLALMIFQDGEGWVKTNGQIRATYVLDNLIHQGAIPPMAGLFINPGRKMPVDLKKKPENRGLEYDSVTNGSLYPTFLVEEMLPEVMKKVRLSSDPNDRGLAGSSSGGICAFTACWERPDQFRKVFSCVGSFVDLRGGHNYPPMIRKTRPTKPIKVFLQDGTNDLDNPYGNWPLANQEMAAALRFSGYTNQLVLGDGSHNSKHGAALFPDAMRWLWKKDPLPASH